VTEVGPNRRSKVGGDAVVGPGLSNQLLGRPRDARLLIINADDLGMCHAINVGIFRALTEGIVTSTTLMVPCPWVLEAVRLLAKHPDIAFGIHLTAIGESATYRWRPLSCRDDVRSLVDESGYLYPFDRMAELFAGLELDELELEFRAQIEWVLAAGLRPTHLDWHSLRFSGAPEIFELMFKLAREYGLALRVRERASIARVQRERLPVNDHDFLDSFSIDTAGKLTTYARLLRELPEGLSEWAVHPGVADEELVAIDGDGAGVRQADLDCTASESIRELVRQEGITLLSYKPLQDVWQRR
jgi:chitin disaccharide deacetylase